MYHDSQDYLNEGKFSLHNHERHLNEKSYPNLFGQVRAPECFKHNPSPGKFVQWKREGNSDAEIQDFIREHIAYAEEKGIPAGYKQILDSGYVDMGDDYLQIGNEIIVVPTERFEITHEYKEFNGEFRLVRTAEYDQAVQTEVQRALQRQQATATAPIFTTHQKQMIWAVVLGIAAMVITYACCAASLSH